MSRETIMDKSLEGKMIYAIPTGNNGRRSDRILVFKVVKVKRKFIELDRFYNNKATTFTENYCPDTGATQKQIASGYGGNAGYKFFRLEEEANEHIEHSELSHKISAYIRENRRKLTLEQCRKIDAIIGGDV